MSVLFFLIPLAAAFVLVALIAFAWAVRSGQFDDLSTPPVRIFFDSVASARPPARFPGEFPDDDERDH